jgi:hypothetical protein
MEKEFINLNIGKQNVIKIDNDDEDEPTCGGKTEVKPVKQRYIPDKTICYKCKVNKSNFFNRNEYICRYYRIIPDLALLK